MKKLILLLMVGGLLADTLLYKQVTESADNVGIASGYNTVDQINTIELTGDFRGTLNGQAYILLNERKLKKIDCINIISIWDDNNHPIQYNCGINTYTPNYLINTGLELIHFRKTYYLGSGLSYLGSTLLIAGAIKNNEIIMIIGGVTNIIGGLITFISFNDIGQAGEELIIAGKEAEKNELTPYKELL